MSSCANYVYQLLFVYEGVFCLASYEMSTPVHYTFSGLLSLNPKGLYPGQQGC